MTLPLPQSHPFFEDVVNTMQEGLLIVAPDGTIQMVNEALTHILGYEREELLGRSCAVLQCDQCQAARGQGGAHWCRLFAQGLERKRRCTVRRKDGHLVPVLKSASLLRHNQEVVGAVETVTDISLLDRHETAIKDLERALDREFCGMVGTAPAMRHLFSLLEKVAQSEAPVMVRGESGTGKELAARAVHECSPRREGPFIQLNCAALNEALLESELFGHVKGAFTGAYRARPGRFEVATGGTLFLDEVGDIPLSVQAKLLRVLETKQIERVGDHRPIEVDVRIVSATNRDLDRLVAEGEFREDLYYRINALPVAMPALRERPEDIPWLATHFLGLVRQNSGKALTGLTPEALRSVVAYPWPGNVRELKSALEYASVLAETGRLETEHLPPHITAANPSAQPAASHSGEETADAQRQALIEALRQSGGNQSRAAQLLGVSRVTVYNRMRKYGLTVQTVVESRH